MDAIQELTGAGVHQSTEREWMIKVRKRGTKAFWFLSSGGRMNRLLIHATRFNDKGNADTALALIEAANPDYEGKVVAA